MYVQFVTSLRSERREPSPRSGFLTKRAFVITALLCAAASSSAQAQSWSSSRQRPKLRQLVSVDATGEAVWPYGSEDVAGDGPTTFADDEAGSDLRSVYADADSKRVWLRAYVASANMPPTKIQVFFFADTDDRDSTGGPAFGQPLWPAWKKDPTPGGYERAIGISGDGKLLGVWSWNNGAKEWAAVTTGMDDVHVELDRDEDPIRIGARVHGYAQVDVDHKLTGLTASCAGNLFVRTWHDEVAPRAFGDDDAEAFDCRPRTDDYGDPAVIRSKGCEQDEDCPNDGRCRDRVCLFAYPCTGDGDCQSDERCTANACIKVVQTTCTDDRTCDGLVCESGACVACTESGTRACAAGLDCSPNGTCVGTADFVPGGGLDGGPDAGLVRGGAFHCSARASNQRSVGAWLLGLIGICLVRRRAKAERRA